MNFVRLVLLLVIYVCVAIALVPGRALMQGKDPVSLGQPVARPSVPLMVVKGNKPFSHRMLLMQQASLADVTAQDKHSKEAVSSSAPETLVTNKAKSTASQDTTRSAETSPEPSTTSPLSDVLDSTGVPV